jgi:hypothetical protein
MFSRTAGPVRPLNGPTCSDETREAVQESERLREKGREAIDEARRIGRDYMPITASAPAPIDREPRRLDRTRPRRHDERRDGSGTPSRPRPA